MKIPGLRAALYHKVEEYKRSHAKRIEEYREIEKMVDPEKKEKTGDLKTLLIYLLNNEDLFNWMVNDFLESWKPLIDNGCIPNER
jgi:hypothetical protein